MSPNISPCFTKFHPDASTCRTICLRCPKIGVPWCTHGVPLFYETSGSASGVPPSTTGFIFSSNRNSLMSGTATNLWRLICQWWMLYRCTFPTSHWLAASYIRMPHVLLATCSCFFSANAWITWETSQNQHINPPFDRCFDVFSNLDPYVSYFRELG